MVCPPVRGDNPRALAVQVAKSKYNNFIPPTSVYTPQFEIGQAKID